MSKERLSCAVNAISGTKWQHELGRAMHGNLLVLPSYLDQAASSRSPSCSPRSRSAPTRASRRSDPASTPPSSRRTFHRRRRPPMTPMAPAWTALAEGRASADAVAGPEVAAAERARQPPFRLSTGKLHFNTAKIADWVSISLSCEISAMDHCIQCNGEASQIRSKFILLSLIPFAKSPLLTISLLLMLLLSGGGGCRGDALKDCRGVDRC